MASFIVFISNLANFVSVELDIACFAAGVQWGFKPAQIPLLEFIVNIDNFLITMAVSINICRKQFNELAKSGLVFLKTSIDT